MVGVRVESLGGAQIRGVESITLLPLLLVLEEQMFLGSNWPAGWLVTDDPDIRGASCPGLASDQCLYFGYRFGLSVGLVDLNT